MSSLLPKELSSPPLALRLGLGFVIAASVSLALFFAMHLMVSGPGEIARESRQSTQVDFVRTKQDTQTQRRERRHKKPPTPKKPQLPKNAVSQQAVEMQQMPINMPDVAADLALSNQSFLGDASVGLGFGDGDVIPLVRIDPKYPSKALRRKIEGFVTARLKINAQGTVDDVKVIEAKPRGVFEREAIRAFYRYKFKPKMLDGRPVAQEATQTVEFNLNKS